MKKQNIVIFTGAGISKESGIDTFRDSKDGLWMNYDVNKVASPEGWAENKMLVTEFYNKRRAQLKDVVPNDAHNALAELESKYNVTIVSQNVDNLHERGGSTDIIHLHGNLNQVRCQYDNGNDYSDVQEIDRDVVETDVCKCHGELLRPHIVWFGESVDFNDAFMAFKTADIVIVCGTSFNISYTIHLVRQCDVTTEIFYVDPTPVDWIYHEDVFKNVTYFAESATTGIRKVVDTLMSR